MECDMCLLIFQNILVLILQCSQFHKQYLFIHKAENYDEGLETMCDQKLWEFLEFWANVWLMNLSSTTRESEDKLQVPESGHIIMIHTPECDFLLFAATFFISLLLFATFFNVTFCSSVKIFNDLMTRQAGKRGKISM